MKMLQCYAEGPWLAMVDQVVARSGAISRADLIERLLREEAQRREVRAVPRLTPSKHNRWRHKGGPLPMQGRPPSDPVR